MLLTADRSGERLDAAMARLAPELSRSAAQKLIEDGAVRLNGRAARKSDRLTEGDTLEFELPQVQQAALEAEDSPLDGVYEAADVIVGNKPKGLVVHPAAGHWSGTLVNALMHHCRDSLSGIGGELRPGIVHRIDKDTSGLLIAAKTTLHTGRLPRSSRITRLRAPMPASSAETSARTAAPSMRRSDAIRRIGRKCA